MTNTVIEQLETLMKDLHNRICNGEKLTKDEYHTWQQLRILVELEKLKC